MSRVLAVALPASDAAFSERVRHVVSQDRWDLDSPEGTALVQAVLRQSYPTATVVPHGVSAGARHRTVALDVYRDGPPGAASRVARWATAVYDRSAVPAYRIAAAVLGEGPAAESVLQQAFGEVRRGVPDDPLVDDSSLDAAVEAVQAAARRLALNAVAARHAAADEPSPRPAAEENGLTGVALRTGSVRRVLTSRALSSLLSIQRHALELAVLEDLKVPQIAERMETSPAEVSRLLRDGLLTVGNATPVSAPQCLERWREAERGWRALPPAHPGRPSEARAVAHAWLDYQVASRGIRSDTTVLITDAARRFIATTAGAATAVGRPSIAGLRIDDITASYARPRVSELWSLFDDNGGMQGEYDCDRPEQTPVRFPFRGIWGRPLPDLQVGYLAPSSPILAGATASD